MHKLIQQLIASGPVVTDGAWGTELQARGLAAGEFPDAWNLSHPERVLEVAKAYVDAGSRIILTNTFGANRVRLSGDELARHVIEMNRNGVAISRQAAQAKALVFASIGPTGKLLMDEGVDHSEIQAAFEEQSVALAEAGADALVIETMCDLNEAKIAVAAAKKTKLPVVACMVFDSGPGGQCTMMGNTPEEVATGLAQAGADVVGANCGQGIDAFAAICAKLSATTHLPIWIKANAGLPTLVEGRARYSATPASFARRVPDLLQVGANFVGGCCGTNPQFITAVKEALKEAKALATA